MKRDQKILLFVGLLFASFLSCSSSKNDIVPEYTKFIVGKWGLRYQYLDDNPPVSYNNDQIFQFYQNNKGYMYSISTDTQSFNWNFSVDYKKIMIGVYKPNNYSLEFGVINITPDTLLISVPYNNKQLNKLGTLKMKYAIL